MKRLKLNSEKHKVFGAMYMTRSFTVNEIALLSGVKEDTVRTVITRNKELFCEDIDIVNTGKRGGQPKRYSLKEEHIPFIENALKENYQNSQKVLYSQPNTDDSNKITLSKPLGFHVAADILNRLYPEASTESEKKDLLKIASINHNAARIELGFLDNDTDVELTNQQKRIKDCFDRQQARLRLEDLQLELDRDILADVVAYLAKDQELPPLGACAFSTSTQDLCPIVINEHPNIAAQSTAIVAQSTAGLGIFKETAIGIVDLVGKKSQNQHRLTYMLTVDPEQLNDGTVTLSKLINRFRRIPSAKVTELDGNSITDSPIQDLPTGAAMIKS